MEKPIAREALAEARKGQAFYTPKGSQGEG
jgi:hypothetical protein